MLDTARPDAAQEFKGLTFDAIAAYGNGRYANYEAARRDFPRLHLLEIDVTGAGIGNAGDFEKGDMQYEHAGPWAKERIAAGVCRPVVYFSASNWGEVMRSLEEAGVARSEVRIWTAHYTGKEHRCSSGCRFGITGTADATQWGSSDYPQTLPNVYVQRVVDVSQTADDFWNSVPLRSP